MLPLPTSAIARARVRSRAELVRGTSEEIPVDYRRAIGVPRQLRPHLRGSAGDSSEYQHVVAARRSVRSVFIPWIEAPVRLKRRISGTVASLSCPEREKDARPDWGVRG